MLFLRNYVREPNFWVSKVGIRISEDEANVLVLTALYPVSILYVIQADCMVCLRTGLVIPRLLFMGTGIHVQSSEV